MNESISLRVPYILNEESFHAEEASQPESSLAPVTVAPDEFRRDTASAAASESIHAESNMS
jgi:hypothetical protein